MRQFVPHMRTSSIEKAEAYLDELSECELKDGDLKHIAGGKHVDVGYCGKRGSLYVKSY